ncbi:MAG: RraA family protein [Methylibium sp.]
MDAQRPGGIAAQALAFGTATLHECCDVPNMLDPAIRPLFAGARMAGPAWPVRCAPGDNLAIHVGMARIPRGSVLVVDAQAFLAGYWGEVLTVAAQSQGVAGVVIDGGVRDTAAIVAMRYPMFVRGVSVKGTVKSNVVSVGEPLLMAGTRVAPGDLVVGDDDGVVCLPADRLAEVLEKARVRTEKEKVFMEQLKQGKTTLDLLGLAQHPS